MLSLLRQPLLGASSSTSYRVVPASTSVADRIPNLIDALRTPSVSVVVLERERCQLPAAEWPIEADASLCVTLAEAATAGAVIDRRFTESFGTFTPPGALEEMRQLATLFAEVARGAGGADADTELRCRIQVETGSNGKCTRLHHDRVALRLSVTFCGEGTRWVPAESSINRAGLLAMLRPESLPPWLRDALLEPWGWYVHNSFLRWPWSPERCTLAGQCLWMKGSAWRPGLPRIAGSGRRARPALHRSPVGRAPGVDARRVLFTIDYG